MLETIKNIGITNGERDNMLVVSQNGKLETETKLSKLQ